MKAHLFPIFLVLSFSTSCAKLDIEKGTPKCIESKIQDFNTAQSCDEGVEVRSYTFQNEIVYVFDPGDCGADMSSEVFDADCNTLGFLGGIAGNLEINGEDFSTAIFLKIIWQK